MNVLCVTRPLSYKFRRQQRFLAAFHQSNSLTEAARKARICRDTHYDWLNEDPSYRERFEQAGGIVSERVDPGTITGRIVTELRRGPRTIVDLEASIGISTKEVSARLTQLRRAGMIRPVGSRVYPDRPREFTVYKAVVGAQDGRRMGLR